MPGHPTTRPRGQYLGKLMRTNFVYDYTGAGYTETIQNQHGRVCYKPNSPYAVAFTHNKTGAISGKPKWNLRFKSTERMMEYAAQWLDALQKSKDSQAAYRLSRRDSARAFAESVHVDQVFSSSWGYEQTNVDFYQVVAKRGMTVSLRRIGSSMVDSSGPMAGHVVASLGRWLDEELIVKRISDGGVRFSAYKFATPWDGQPKYMSWYA